ncbi:hypothetical protein B0A49_06336 [Cryomyces minteri]|uniref:DH domain-containing protein n=1 Tax=Cryomyces minteri TaxID=331657 RepID=A0A4U0X135_9PEZI|nr:hypothetical protein B0A49_06336 [Cryomyces minteri]
MESEERYFHHVPVSIAITPSPSALDENQHPERSHGDHTASDGTDADPHDFYRLHQSSSDPSGGHTGPPDPIATKPTSTMTSANSQDFASRAQLSTVNHSFPPPLLHSAARSSFRSVSGPASSNNAVEVRPNTALPSYPRPQQRSFKELVNRFNQSTVAAVNDSVPREKRAGVQESERLDAEAAIEKNRAPEGEQKAEDSKSQGFEEAAIPSQHVTDTGQRLDRSKQSFESSPPEQASRLRLVVDNIPRTHIQEPLTGHTEFEMDDSPVLGRVDDVAATEITSLKGDLDEPIVLQELLQPATSVRVDGLLQPLHEQGTVLSQVMKMRQRSVSSASHTDFAEDTASDNHDTESIKIMLGETPTITQQDVWTGEDQERTEGLQSTESNADVHEASSRNEISAEELAPLQESSSVHPEDPISSRVGNHSPEETPILTPWTPSLSSVHDGHLTLDSESYSAISRILEQYHDPTCTAEIRDELQRQFLSLSPDLARQGSWDHQRTHEYLENLLNGIISPTLTATSYHSNEKNSSVATTVPAIPGPREGSPTDGTLGTAIVYEDVEGHSPNVPDVFYSPRVVSDEVVVTERASEANSGNQKVAWNVLREPDLDTSAGAEHEYRPIPPPKDWNYSPKPGAKHQGLTMQDVELTSHLSSHDLLRIPQNSTIGQELGLAIQVDSPAASPTFPPPPPPEYSPPPPPPPPPLIVDENLHLLREGRPSPAASTQTKTSRSSTFPAPAREERSPRRRSSLDTINNSVHRSSASLPNEAPRAPSLEHATPEETALSPEQRRLKKRKFLIKEIVDTEFSYHHDMKIIEDMYKGTSTMISEEDRRTLFGNSDQIVEFSLHLLDVLRQAASSVYTMPRSIRWRLKRGSMSTSHSGNTEQSPLNGPDIPEEEDDRQTTIGQAFGHNIARMEKVYSSYLRNNNAAAARLQKIQSQRHVAQWLHECQEAAKDITSAWDLGSLIVKPVQRLLKYPLLLKELLEVTPKNHPDYAALDIAAREIVGVAQRIDEAKKRAELVDQVVNRKRKESDVRIGGLSKAFGRHTEKLRQQVGLSDAVEDPVYKAISEKWGGHYIILQVVLRDVERYLAEVQDFVDHHNGLVVAMEAIIDVGQSQLPEVESKWRRYAMAIRELTATALPEHKAAIYKRVTDPLVTAIKLHVAPDMLMQKRKKRIVDYAKFKAITARGEKPDKKTQELAEQYLALNETLKEELPKLYSLSAALSEACLKTFVDIQQQWLLIWQRKISSMLEDQQIPRSFSEISEAFSADHDLTLAQVESLGLCNGSMLHETANFLSPSSTMYNDDPNFSYKRSGTLTSSKRTMSVNSDLSPVLPTPDFARHSSSFALGPFGEAMFAPNGLSTSVGRMRASSGVSSRGSSTPTANSVPASGPHSLSNTMLAGSYFMPRPSTSTGRSADPSPAPPRLSADLPRSPRPISGSNYFSSNLLSSQRSNASPATRFSGVFSSALPLSDSPNPTRPATPQLGSNNVPVLFLAASLFEFNIDNTRKEAGYPYLSYVCGEIFDVVAQKGEIWLAKNQDDTTNRLGWIWEQHFAILPALAAD